MKMKLKLIAPGIAAALALGTIAVSAENPGAGPHRGHGRGMHNPLEHLTRDLNLTPDQQAKVSPIIDQARPQIRAIHQEAMQKMRTVMDNTTAQIRPLLTPEQQQKLDSIQKAHEHMHQAMQEMHDATDE